jgi:hypothetical protein
MIKTGDWTIADLIKYLVAVRSTLNSEEIDRLKMTAAFSSEGDRFCVIDQEKPIRRRANQLYEPLEIFRQLKIPIIDWGTQTKWRASSEEGESSTLAFDWGLIIFQPNFCMSSV